MLILETLRLTLRSLRVVHWQYAANLLLGALVLLPAYSTLKTEFGQSMEFTKLLDGFDYTVYEDFMNTRSHAFRPFRWLGLWLGVAYVLLNVFFTGGTLLVLHRAGQPVRAPGLGEFLQACVHYFPRYLKLAAFSGLLILLWTGIVLTLGVLWAVVGEDTLTESGYGLLIGGGLVLFAMPTLFVLCAADYARVLMFRQDERRALRGFGLGVRLVGQRFRTTFGTYGFLLLLSGLWLAGYWRVESAWPTTGWLTIGLLFVVQQGFIWGRIMLKVGRLAAACRVVDAPRADSAARVQPAPA